MLVGAAAALPSLPNVPDSTRDACAWRGGSKLNAVKLKAARLKWHETKAGARHSFKPSSNMWAEEDERKEELCIE